MQCTESRINIFGLKYDICCSKMHVRQYTVWLKVKIDE